MYAIVGATGNTGSVVASTLLDRGQKVRVIGRSADRLQSFVQRGAESFVGDVTDREALTRAFTGAGAVYAMIPPNMTVPDYGAYERSVIDAITAALEQARVKHVVALSSIGADKESGTGPVQGLHHFERRIESIPGINSLGIRAAYFMENFLEQLQPIRKYGIMGDTLNSDVTMPVIASRDIGAYAAERLLKLDFSGHQTRELLGNRDLNMTEAAAIIGKAIGKLDLKYVQLPEEQFRAAVMEEGLSASLTDALLEMNRALNSGHMRALEPRTAVNTTPTSLEQFVQEVFVPAFRGASQAA